LAERTARADSARAAHGAFPRTPWPMSGLSLRLGPRSRGRCSVAPFLSRTWWSPRSSDIAEHWRSMW